MAFSCAPRERQCRSNRHRRSAWQTSKYHGAFSGMVAIFVQDPTAIPASAGVAFAELYNLTPSELRVLLAIAPGLSAKKAAQTLGICETTAKTHLQHMYSKTGTSKRIELMHLFRSSTPPIKSA